MFKAAMLWNWAILRCSIIEDVDIWWTETLLIKLQIFKFYIIKINAVGRVEKSKNEICL